MIYRHSFAKVWLNRLGNEIYINNKNFFAEDIDKIKAKFPIKPLKTFIRIGENLLDAEELSEITSISYPDMKKNLGLAIYRIRAGKKAWRKAQQFILVIAKTQSTLNAVPEGTIRSRNTRGTCKLEWNKKLKCVRGVGEDFGLPDGQYGNGDITPWILYGEKEKGAKNVNVLVKHDSYDEISENLFDSWMGKPKKKTYKLEIKELPVMITSDGKLLCMPYDKDYVPKIVMVGETGSGKTFTLNSILGRALYVYHDKIGILNDSQNQLYDLMLPMDKIGFIKELGRIGNEPRYLPVINLYMSCPNLKMEYQDERVGFRLVISFKEFLYKWRYYTYGVGRWDLGKAQSYLTNNVINSICDLKTADEIKSKLFEVIETEIIDDKGKTKKKEGMINMIMKWHSKFENMLRDEFTSNLFLDEETTAPYWKLKTKDGEELAGHPFIISSYAGLCPVINNSQAKDRPIAPKHLADITKKIVKWQTEMAKNKKRIWIGIDELKDLLGKKGSDVYDALDHLFTQGRFPMIGFIGNLQEYTKMSDSMQNNTSHLVVFDLRKDSERRAIVKDYRLDKDKLDELSELKAHQCLFITKKKMVIYDSDGKREVKKEGIGGLWKGKIVPPVTIHKKPSD